MTTDKNNFVLRKCCFYKLFLLFPNYLPTAIYKGNNHDN